MLDHSNKLNEAAYMCSLAPCRIKWKPAQVYELSLFGSTPLFLNWRF
jgi:hypothetical protein